MFDVELLRKIMQRNGITNERLACAMGKSRDNLQRKLRGELRFTLADLRIMRECIPLSDDELLQIFFR